MDNDVNDLFGRIHFFKPDKGEHAEFQVRRAAGMFPAVMAYDASKRRFLFRTPVAREEVMGCKVTTYIRNAISEEQLDQILEDADSTIWKYGSADESQVAAWRANMRSSLDLIRAKGVSAFIRVHGFGEEAVRDMLVAEQVMVHVHTIGQRI